MGQEKPRHLGDPQATGCFLLWTLPSDCPEPSGHPPGWLDSCDWEKLPRRWDALVPSAFLGVVSCRTQTLLHC